MHIQALNKITTRGKDKIFYGNVLFNTVWQNKIKKKN